MELLLERYGWFVDLALRVGVVLSAVVLVGIVAFAVSWVKEWRRMDRDWQEFDHRWSGRFGR